MEAIISCIEAGDPAYPESLRQLGDAAPRKLWYTGDISLMKRRCAAVVGSRKPSQYGKWVAREMGCKLAENDIVTVSGMAMGCDSEAHTGALDAGGMTIAVLGCGVDICYPKRSFRLRERIVENGLIISEYPPGTPPLPAYFPMRNRIISGLCELVVVAEAALSSGSLITAGYAAEQGRDLMAVPGYITSPLSLGCNKLIQDGVTPVICIDDVIRALGIKQTVKSGELNLRLGRDERIIYNVVKNNGEISADIISRETGKAVGEVNAIVSILEIKGFLLSDAGKICVAK